MSCLVIWEHVRVEALLFHRKESVEVVRTSDQDASCVRHLGHALGGEEAHRQTQVIAERPIYVKYVGRTRVKWPNYVKANL